MAGVSGATICVPGRIVRQPWSRDGRMSNFEIVDREDYSDVTYMLEIRHPAMAKAAKAG